MKSGTPVQIRKDAVSRMPLSHCSAACDLQHADNSCHICVAVCRDVFEADLVKHLSRRRRDI
jgi:hypothetical protein